MAFVVGVSFFFLFSFLFDLQRLNVSINRRVEHVEDIVVHDNQRFGSGFLLVYGGWFLSGLVFIFWGFFFLLLFEEV